MRDPHAILLETHGKTYATPSGVEHQPYRRDKQCFRNALFQALDDRTLTYVEGYADFLIPIHHAWLVDQQGNVIETTWKTPGDAYFGIPFQTEYVADYLQRTKHFSVLWNRGHVLSDPVGDWLHPSL